MCPAKVISKKGVFFVPEGQFAGNIPEVTGSLPPKIAALLTGDGYSSILSTKVGFVFSEHPSWSVEFSPKGVKFNPPYIEDQVTGQGPGLRVRKYPPSIEYKNNIWIKPATTREMQRALASRLPPRSRR